MICPQCGAEVREGELICQVCNSLLTAPGATRRLEEATGLLEEEVVDVLQMVIFKIADKHYSILVDNGYTILIGRGLRQTTRPNESVLDLMGMNGENLGVSRRHAVIHIEDGEAYLTDLGSTNGTQINGWRIKPQERQVLYSGDKLRFGRLEASIQLS